LWLARAVGIGASFAVIALYASSLFPGAASEGTARAHWVVGIMALVAAVAAWGSLKAKPWVLVVAFFASFPIGLYLAFAPGPLRWVLLCSVVYVVAAGTMALLRASHGPTPGGNRSQV